jgi:hypothetical protein
LKFATRCFISPRSETGHAVGAMVKDFEGDIVNSDELLKKGPLEVRGRR